MTEETVYMIPNPPTAAARSVIIDHDLCDGCNICVEVCQTDVLMPNPEEGKPPIILYPDECWYGGCCTFYCPKGAMKLNYPLNWRVPWKDKETGKYYWYGMKNNPLPPNPKPPV